MTPADFRQSALSMPEAVESAHFGQADFRVRKKIFSGMDFVQKHGTLKLSPEDQTLLIDAVSTAAFPAPGSWGAKGWTKINLADFLAKDLPFWMERAWRITAPTSLVRNFDAAQVK
jgi:hypothetical protein